MFGKALKSFCVSFVILAVIVFSNVYATEWVSISGEVSLGDGTPLCAIVLANGQHMFTCAPDGQYNLDVPLGLK